MGDPGDPGDTADAGDAGDAGDMGDLGDLGDVVRFPRTRQEYDAQRPPLWREAVGEVLRDERHRARRTLRDVADEAGLSVQYLSEIERGRKEPSSEMIAAVSGALGLDLAGLTAAVARRLSPARGPVCLAA